MEVFLSWSGKSSRDLAQALRTFLLAVFGARVKPWFSPADIAKGKQWNRELSAALERIQFGIICATSANRDSSWLLFEAGALAKTVDRANICPYLLDIRVDDLEIPLRQFQATQANKAETRLLVSHLNAVLSPPLHDSKIGLRRSASPAAGHRKTGSPKISATPPRDQTVTRAPVYL